MLNTFQLSRYTVDLPGFAAFSNRRLAQTLYCIGPRGGCGRMGPAPGTWPVGCRRYGASGPSKLHKWAFTLEPLDSMEGCVGPALSAHWVAWTCGTTP